jgi:hypothetical protein
MSRKNKTTNKKNHTLKNILTRPNQLNCNPNVSGDKVVRGSCLPENILQILKKSYNESNPYNQITNVKPRSIWKDLKKRLRTCTKEDCWLNVISDPQYREKIEKYLYVQRPLQPGGWKNDPNQWLSNHDIDNVLIEYENSYPMFKAIQTATIDFDDLCYIEDLCKLKNKEQVEEYLKLGKTKIGVVFNLDKFSEGGSHWVSLFLDLQNGFVFFFDSNGDKIPIEIKKLIERLKKHCRELETPIELKEYNNYKVRHQRENSECGMYSLFFIITLLTGKINNIPVNSLDETLDLFRKSRVPDKYVSNFRKIYFKV